MFTRTLLLPSAVAAFATASFTCVSLRAVAADAPVPETAVFPFVLPWDDATPGITDVSGWFEQPAGKSGPVRVGEDGHFYRGDRRVRFFGVNMSFAAGMPRPEDADKLAGRLAKFGVNVVRFHHMDTGAWPNGIRDDRAKGSGALHPEALARLDHFIARLKAHGISANLNLLVGRPFNAADGLPAEIERLEWKDRHLVGFFDAKALALQKDYARALLTHVNPHTGLAYTADPAVAFVEINNEQGLVHGWLGGQVDRLPEVFLRGLRAEWNYWLTRVHKGTENLRAAWAAGEEPLGAEMIADAGFASDLRKWTLEQHNGAQMTATLSADVPGAVSGANPAARSVQLRVARRGAESWHLQFNQADLPLTAGRAYTLSFWAKADARRTISVIASQAHEPWQNLGLAANPQLTTEWREVRLLFNATQDDRPSRVTFSNFGGEGAAVWLAGVSLKPGGVSGLQPGETPADAQVPLFTKTAFGGRTVAAQRDWMGFLTEAERLAWQEMYVFLKDELKVQAPITGTIAGCSPVNVQAAMDWVDTHAYWQHPRWTGRAWDAEDWLVDNKTLVNERGGTVSRLSLWRVAGKPHACTEYNHPAPNTYSSEGFLLLAAYAALQDWDALYVYSYAHTRGQGWDGRQINGFFDIDQHPTKMATLPAAAALFLRGDVQPARQVVVAALGTEREVDLLRGAGAWTLVNGEKVGLRPELALLHRVGLVTEGRVAPPGALRSEEVRLDGNRFTSDTGELVWDVTKPGRGLVTVNTPKSKAVIGYAGGHAIDLGGVVVRAEAGLQDGWCALTATAVAGTFGSASDEPMRAARLLITATGYAENTGMQWKNPEKSSVGRNWGGPPSRVEGVRARVILPAPAERVEAWALDDRGQPRQRLPVTAAPANRASVVLGPQWETLWYEVRIR